MRLALLILAASLVTAVVHATTLPPELKAYDFCAAYYIEDGGVVLSPYDHGFYCPAGIATPEGIRIMPGDRFVQFNPDRLLWEEYHFVRLNDAQTRAFFHENIFRYKTVRDEHGTFRKIRQQLLATDDFYLTQFRGMELFDHVFPNIELHPGDKEWQSEKR